MSNSLGIKVSAEQLLNEGELAQVGASAGGEQ